MKANKSTMYRVYTTVYKKVYIKFILKMNVAYINSLTFLSKPKLVGTSLVKRKLRKNRFLV